MLYWDTWKTLFEAWEHQASRYIGLVLGRSAPAPRPTDAPVLEALERIGDQLSRLEKRLGALELEVVPWM